MHRFDKEPDMQGDAAVALVTGASSGIGQASAALLARSGYRVFGTSRREAAGDGAVSMLRLDVTDEASVQACVAEVMARAGRVDLLVNNAGFAMVGALEDSTTEQARAIFDTNLFGVMRVTRAVLPHMRAAGRGRIVNISSVVGFLPSPFSGLYAATKHALEAYSESLDHEVRTLGIRSVLVEPGFTRSNIGSAMPAPDAALPVYAAARANMASVFSKALQGAASADGVARTVLRAATAPAPKLRYPAGRDAATLSVLRRLMPPAILDRSLRKQFNLDGAAPVLAG